MSQANLMQPMPTILTIPRLAAQRLAGALA